MANLPESSTFDEGVYQIETSDPVIGGPSGISNFQAKTLANRTRYLKNAVDVLQDDMDTAQSDITALQTSDALKAPLASPALTGAPTTTTPATSDNSTRIANTAFVQTLVAALVDSSPAALDTLNELAAALGDDPNFATTVTNLIALKAAIDSPTFTGDPKAPTASQFDNDTSLATTAFVQTALGNMRGGAVINSAITLGAFYIGKAIQLSGAGSYTVTLPPVSGVPDGSVIEFVCTTTNVTLAGNGSELIYPNMGTGIASVVLNASESATIKKINGVWGLVGGSEAIVHSGFASQLSPSGFQKLPSGLIIQWGLLSFTNQTMMQKSYNIAFPNAALWVGVSQASHVVNVKTLAADRNATLTAFDVYTDAAVTAAIGGYWLAIGN